MASLLIPPPPPLAPEDLPALPPTQDELPCDDGAPMETLRHQFLMDLLTDVMDRWLEARGDGFAGSARGRIHNPTLNLDLGRWQGTFRGVEAVWLRWFTPEGEMPPTEAEAAQHRAEAAQHRAERLAERLRQLGVDPDAL